MALKSYVVTKDFKTPYVVSTGQPHRPTQIKIKNFKRGEIINGELKHSNNEPAFVLVKGVLVVPLGMIKEVVTKEINSSAEGEKKPDTTAKKIVAATTSKIKYVDALVIGALIGLGGAYLAEKKGWIAVPDKKNKLIGAGIGAALALYLTYRFKNKPVVQNKQ